MHWVTVAAEWFVPALVCGIPVFGLIRHVNVYDAFVTGAKDGLQISVQLLPFMVAIFVAVGLFRTSGAMADLVHSIGPLIQRVGLPMEVVPLAIVRPLSGSAALALVIDILKHQGPDSMAGRIASVMQGAADTTFYIVAVYFGSVGVRRSRWALPVGLIGDFAGFAAAVIVCRWLFIQA